MNQLFSPAFALLGRMRYSQKFLLTGGVLLLPMLYLLWTTMAPIVQSVAQAGRMRQGAESVQSIQPLVLAMQKHRGLTNMLLSGNTAVRTAIPPVAQQVATTFGKIQANLAAQGDAFAVAEPLAEIRAEWDGLAVKVAGMQSDESFAAHSNLIAKLLALINRVADSAALTRDADAGIYHLQDVLTAQALPLIDALGQARGLTAGVLTRGAISDAEKIDIAILMGRAQVHAEHIQFDMAQAIAARPELAVQLESHMHAVEDSVQAFQGLTAINSIRERFTLDSQTYFSEATRPLEATIALSAAASEGINQLLEQRRAQNLRVLRLTGAGVLSLLALAGYLALAMQLAITADVGRIEQAASALAAGDLTHAMNVASRDEIGRIAAAFEQARRAIADLVINAARSATLVAATARDVSENAGCCSGAANRQSESVSAAAAAVEQMAVSSAHIADQTQEANMIAQEAGKLADRGHEAINAVRRDIRQIDAGVRQAAQQVAGLNTRASEISSIVQVIRDIADQTNLLALNAAIEAARAGELGRGFAVVADEVRKLAERTARATTEIADQIMAVQAESADAVGRIEVSQQQAMAGVATVETATRALSDIRHAVDGVLERVTEIASASAEQKAASNGVAINVEHIAAMTESNSATAAIVSQQASRMGELVDVLDRELRRFNIQASSHALTGLTEYTADEMRVLRFASVPA